MHADGSERIGGQLKPAKRAIRLDLLIVAVLVALGLAGAAYWIISSEQKGPPIIDEPVATAPINTNAEPAASAPVHKPAEFDDEQQALHEAYQLPDAVPDLNDSDSSLIQQLQAIKALEPIMDWSAMTDIARQASVLAYNMADGYIAYRSLPVLSPEGRFSVKKRGDGFYMSPESYQRYDRYTLAFAELDLERIVTIYRFFWPTLEAAFSELGEPNKSLHNEIIKAIDHLLATPEPSDDVLLVRPAVYYKYADPSLEALSPAQKQMLRFGASNRFLIKAQLEQLKPMLMAGQTTR